MYDLSKDKLIDNITNELEKLDKEIINISRRIPKQKDGDKVIKLIRQRSKAHEKHAMLVNIVSKSQKTKTEKQLELFDKV